MFVHAIEVAGAFTRPIHTITRNYGSTHISPGAATLFLVNSDGWALTCGHVAHHLMGSDQLHTKRQKFNAEVAAIRGQKREKQLLRDLERKYQYSRNTPLEVYNRFVNCVEGPLQLEIKLHPSADVALIHFQNFTRILCDSFPTFAAKGGELKQGKFLCRIGFPFPEFANFAYDTNLDKIDWTQTCRDVSPQFPIEGMVTRRLRDDNNQIIGFEMSTAGLRGQSGGPAFDTNGRIWGMQAATRHLDLNFDVNQEVYT